MNKWLEPQTLSPLSCRLAADADFAFARPPVSPAVPAFMCTEHVPVNLPVC